MKIRLLLIISSLLSLPAMAQADGFYCPTGHGYINLGMNQEQVITACGQPSSIEKSNQALIQQVPVTQLIYTNLNQGAPYSGLNVTYQMWSLSSGTTQVGMQVNVINNQVSSIEVNGQSENAMSVCGGTPIQIGDSADSVYAACGNPSMVNQTYIKQPVRTSDNAKPETWVYDVGDYTPPFRLTFLNGILQSIGQ
jgi:hypothetical protein